MSSQYSTRHNAHSHCMDCETNSSVFEDKNFSLVRESVTEWKFKTVLASSWVFPIRWNCAFVRSLRLSLNSLCFSFHFSSSRKAIHYSFIHISTLRRTLHAHSISLAFTLVSLRKFGRLCRLNWREKLYKFYRKFPSLFHLQILFKFLKVISRGNRRSYWILPLTRRI